MSEKKRLGCSAPIFAPRCNKYTPKDGCLEEARCHYQYEKKEEETRRPEPSMNGEIYQIYYLKDTDEFDIRPWGMTIYLNYDEIVKDLENVLAFIKNHSSSKIEKEDEKNKMS